MSKLEDKLFVWVLLLTLGNTPVQVEIPKDFSELLLFLKYFACKLKSSVLNEFICRSAIVSPLIFILTTTGPEELV